MCIPGGSNSVGAARSPTPINLKCNGVAIQLRAAHSPTSTFRCNGVAVQRRFLDILPAGAENQYSQCGRRSKAMRWLTFRLRTNLCSSSFCVAVHRQTHLSHAPQRQQIGLASHLGSGFYQAAVPPVHGIELPQSQHLVSSVPHVIFACPNHPAGFTARARPCRRSRPVSSTECKPYEINVCPQPPCAYFGAAERTEPRQSEACTGVAQHANVAWYARASQYMYFIIGTNFAMPIDRQLRTHRKPCARACGTPAWSGRTRASWRTLLPHIPRMN